MLCEPIVPLYQFDSLFFTFLLLRLLLILLLLSILIFFFFQAEDGIRDHCVTGVQTCALPISGWSWRARSSMAEVMRGAGRLTASLITAKRWCFTASRTRQPGRFAKVSVMCADRKSVV